MCPVPNSRPDTDVAPRKFASCIARFTFENRDPARNGANPPRLNSPNRANPYPTPHRPHHGWKKSPGPSGSQPIDPNPKPTPNPNPPPKPKNETYAGAQIGR